MGNKKLWFIVKTKTDTTLFITFTRVKLYTFTLKHNYRIKIVLFLISTDLSLGLS